MKTYRVIIGLAIVVLFMAAAAYWYYSSRHAAVFLPNGNAPGMNQPEYAATSTQGGVTENTGPSDTQRRIRTNDGSTLVASDFLKDAIVSRDPYNEGSYFIGQHQTLGTVSTQRSTQLAYEIVYDLHNDFFTIALLEEPIGEARQSAEQFLQTVLAIPPDQLCRLKYSLAVPNRVNAMYSSINLGFSFCPGATKLPL